MYRGPDSSTTDVWSGSYLSHATLPVYLSDETRISELSMDVECVDSTGGLRAVSPTCNFEVELTYSNLHNTFRSGTIFASGEYSSSYDITGGTDSFNFASGTLQAVFDSNDPHWYKNIEVDVCFVYPEVGDAVKCIGDTDEEGVPDTAIYRMTSSTEIQRYPSEAVAFSWGNEWHYNVKTIDCTDMIIGDDIAMKPAGLVHGKTVFCFDDTVAVPRSGYYRWMDFQLREYPSGEIASSWDSKWTLTERIDCTGLSIGQNMALRPSVDDNQTVQCKDNTDGSNEPTRVYRFIDDKIRHYPHEIIAHTWDYDWHFNPIKSIDCTGLTIGKPMTPKIHGLNEDDMVKCSNDTDLSDNPYKVYRYSHAGLLRYLPNPTIASSWDSLWHQDFKTIDCSGIPHIDDMPLHSNR